jgi:hypothetical protein
MIIKVHDVRLRLHVTGRASRSRWLLQILGLTIIPILISQAPAKDTTPPLKAEKASVKLYQLPVSKIDSLIKDTSRTHSNTTEKIAFYSRLSLGTPYVRGCLGEGARGKYDKDPLIDFSRVDCMTFCEQVLALSISHNYQNAFQTLQKIRYLNGNISFTARNHFVMADWLPHNQWLLKDITEETGGPLCKEMEKTIDRRTFADSFGYNDPKNFSSPRQFTIKYLPKKYLPTISDKLQGSEIMVIITSREGIFASHLGFIIREKKGPLIFRHGSLTQKKVIDEPYDRLCRRLQEDQHTAGIVLIRVRKDLL